MKIGEEYEVEIEKFSNLGTGIARIDGQVVFVENSCPEDTLKIKISNVTRNFANAQIVKIIKSSPNRTEPFCPMQKVCGACQLQFIKYNYQLELKRQIVEDAIRKIGNIDTPINPTIPSPKIQNYRQKIQYPVAVTKNSKRLLAGYYKPKSHDIVNIKYCPIQPEICDKIIEFVRDSFPKNYAQYLRHIVIRGSEYSNKFLLTLVVKKNFDVLNDYAKSVIKEFECISGVCANINSKDTNVILSDKTICLAGSNYIEEKILDKVFKIGADTFFQVNPKSAENIFKYVKDEVSKLDCPSVLDIYAGIAVFGIVVSDVAKSVVSVEENTNSISMAKDVLQLNKIKNIELFAKDSLKYLKSIKKKFDIIILDPPRKGCTKEVLDEIINHAKDKIIYVSCNPATLARDLKYLKENGYKTDKIQPFDMFCHTYHVETVAIISKIK